MTEQASLTDLRLVLAIHESGSIGGAATLLHLSQPSASQRLAVLERRVGVLLVERDTTGARLTPAGVLFAEHGGRALDLVAEAVAAARSPAGLRLSVGTIGSLAPVVFPALQRLLPDHVVEHRTDHGRPLVRAVADGALDAAVVGLGPAESPAVGVRRTKLGQDPVVLVGELSGPPSRRRPLSGLRVAVATYDYDASAVEDRVARKGGEPMQAASTATALAMARRPGWLAAVPRTALPAHGVVGPVASTRLGVDCQLWLVTRSVRADVLVERITELRAALGLPDDGSRLPAGRSSTFGPRQSSERGVEASS
jgi:DNA-binding transcriptional LysR family regulator